MEDYKSKLSHLLSAEHWRIVKRYNENYLNQSLQRLAGSAEPLVVDKYIDGLAVDEGKAVHFIEALNNSTSCFFRNNFSFSVLEKVVLPDIFARKIKTDAKSVRIWSMAAAAGQELYSVAILLDELSHLHRAKLNIQLFASDISEEQLQNAKKGLYKEKDIGELTEKRLNKYFRKDESGHYALDRTLIDNVSFNCFDLTDSNCTCPPESVFGDFDLVICANVLIYYNNEYVEQIFHKINRCMVSDACVMTSESERNLFEERGFVELIQQSGVFTRKKNGFI